MIMAAYRLEIVDLHARILQDTATILPDAFPVLFHSSETFSFDMPGIHVKGNVSSPESDIISGLLEESAIRLQSTCSVRPQGTHSLQNTIEVSCSLSIIIYGPISMAEDVGSFLGDVGVFLQDPFGCVRNVKYCNPQRLSTHEEADFQTTFECDSTTGPAHLEDFHSRKGVIEAFHSNDNLHETEQPEILKTTLRRYVSVVQYCCI